VRASVRAPIGRVVPARVVDHDHPVDETVRENLLVRALERARGVVRRHDDHDTLSIHHRAL
jgi:hypothetical protein